MKRLFAALLALALLLGANAALAHEEGIQIIGGTTAGDGGDIAVGEKVSLDRLCDFTLLGVVADSIAMSIPAYTRPDDELVTTPKVNDWSNVARYKFTKNSDNYPYAEMYLDIDAAAAPSSDEYMLVDIQLDILNKAIAPMEVPDTFKMTLTYDDYYTFDLKEVRMEKTDTQGNPNEWLVPATPIPSLVERVTHFLFEVPKVVATGRESLTAVIQVDDGEYQLVIR